MTHYYFISIKSELYVKLFPLRLPRTAIILQCDTQLRYNIYPTSTPAKKKFKKNLPYHIQCYNYNVEMCTCNTKRTLYCNSRCFENFIIMTSYFLLIFLFSLTYNLFCIFYTWKKISQNYKGISMEFKLELCHFALNHMFKFNVG